MLSVFQTCQFHPGLHPSLEIPDQEQRNLIAKFYLVLSKLTKFKTGTEKYILLMIVLFPGWPSSSMEIPNEEQSDNTIILVQNLIYSYLN